MTRRAPKATHGLAPTPERFGEAARRPPPKRGLRAVAPVAVALLALWPGVLWPGVVVGQGAVSIEHFDGWRDWPLYEAGDLRLENDALGPQRTLFEFPLPTGGTTTMTVDVLPAHLRGEPALWIEHTSSGVPGDTAGTTVIDALLVDRETFRVAFRIQGARGTRSWMGPYRLTQHRPDRILAVTVEEDGTVEKEELGEASDPFDFAAMPYLFPFMEIEEGRGLRLLNIGTAADLTPRKVPIRVIGDTTITDANGREHDVTEIQRLSNSERALYTIWVTDEPSFWYGWRGQWVEDGRTIWEWRYREHEIF